MKKDYRCLGWKRNSASRRRGKLTIILTSLMALELCGCGEHQPKLGVQHWKPKPVGGLIEVRPLPPANQVSADYTKWLEDDGAKKKARVYETTLRWATNQVNFTTKILTGDTPLGQSRTTKAAFAFRNTTNGWYYLTWSRRGRCNADFLKLGDHGKQVWIRPVGELEESGIPEMQIVAFEGLEATGLLIAEPGLLAK